MKILIINASQRKRNTYNLLKRIDLQLTQDKQKNNIQTEYLQLTNYNVKACTGCESCIKTGNCPLKDDTTQIFEKIKTADGIIIGTPVYLRQPSGSLKVLLDRACSWYHRTPIAGKPVFLVATTQASGLKSTTKLLKDISTQFGLNYTGKISRSMFNMQKPIKNKALKKFIFFLDFNNQKYYRPHLNEIIEYNTQKMLASAGIIEKDQTYWRQKALLDKPYYYKCRINIIYRIIGFIYHKTGHYFIKKAK